MLLQIAAGNFNTPQNFIAPLTQHARHPAEHFEIIRDALIDIIEIMPDQRVARVARLHRFNVACLDGRNKFFRQCQYRAHESIPFILFVTASDDSRPRLSPA